MSEEAKAKEEDEWSGLETVSIAANGQWFDIVNLVLYENRAPFSIRLGLGHTPRQITHIVIAKATKDDEQQLKAKAMEGEIISE